MNFISRVTDLFRRTPKPQPKKAPPKPALVPQEQTFKVTEDGRLKPQVRSLDEYYAAHDVQHEALEILRTMQYAEELKSEDTTLPDTDHRDVHVVLPEKGFEFHPESGYVLEEGRVHVTGDDSKATTTKVEDSWKAKNQAATWDKEAGTLHYTYKAEERPGSQAGKGPKSLVSEGQFTISADGQVDLPQATSLAAARENAPSRENAKRAQQILDAVGEWDSLAQAQDKKDADLDDRAGHIVAPNIQQTSDKEAVLSESFSWGGEMGDDELPYHGFDLEKTGNRLFVAGSDGYGNAHGASLLAEHGENSLHVVVQRPELGTVEKVHWNVADGSVNYAKLQKG